MSEQDWMRHDHQPQPKAERTYPEETIWTLRKGARIAEARIRDDGHGLELRLYVDGQWLWGERERQRPLSELAAEKRQDFLDRGWMDAPTR